MLQATLQLNVDSGSSLRFPLQPIYHTTICWYSSITRVGPCTSKTRLPHFINKNTTISTQMKKFWVYPCLCGSHSKRPADTAFPRWWRGVLDSPRLTELRVGLPLPGAKEHVTVLQKVHTQPQVAIISKIKYYFLVINVFYQRTLHNDTVLQTASQHKHLRAIPKGTVLQNMQVTVVLNAHFCGMSPLISFQNALFFTILQNRC